MRRVSTYVFALSLSFIFLHSNFSGEIVYLSRQHALLTTETIGDKDVNIWVEVVGNPMNGLYVNHVRVSKSLVKDGDIITFGAFGMYLNNKQPLIE